MNEVLHVALKQSHYYIWKKRNRKAIDLIIKTLESNENSLCPSEIVVKVCLERIEVDHAIK